MSKKKEKSSVKAEVQSEAIKAFYIERRQVKTRIYRLFLLFPLISFNSQPFEISEQFTFVSGSVVIILSIIENLIEVLKPSLIHHRAMG